jgi:hypothetical protein
MGENNPHAELEQKAPEESGGYRSDGKESFKMIQRGDYIKAGWWHWRCRRATCAGEVDYGYVQADSLGVTIAAETFEKDWDLARHKR